MSQESLKKQMSKKQVDYRAMIRARADDRLRQNLIEKAEKPSRTLRTYVELEEKPKKKKQD